MGVVAGGVPHQPWIEGFGGDDGQQDNAAEGDGADQGGRMGVAILDTASTTPQGWRMHERFPMCSTFKFLLASAVLVRKDQGKEQLERKIVYSKDVVVANSPVSGPRADGDGMTGPGQFEDVGIQGVVREAGHGNGLVPAGQGQAEVARGGLRVGAEQLEEVADAEQDQRVGVAPLDLPVLLHQWCFAHRQGSLLFKYPLMINC